MNKAEKTNRLKDKAFNLFGIFCTFSGLLILIVLLVDVFSKGGSRLSWDFITGLPSRFPEKAGILTPLMGSIWILILTAIIAFPIGVAAAIHLEEYGSKNRLSKLIEINIANLAGVPSIIYGLLGLQVFSRWGHLGSSLLAGALTLALLILPIIIVATREAIKAVPQSIREASCTGWIKMANYLDAGIASINGGNINRCDFGIIKGGWGNSATYCNWRSYLCCFCTFWAFR